MKNSPIISLLTALFIVFLSGCATESNRAIETEKTQAASSYYSGQRSTIAVGNFANRSPYQRGVFSDGTDRLGNQAKTILITHLQQTNRFSVLDRDNMDQLSREAEISGETQSLVGASYVITGDVTEFGRRQTSSFALFGILGRGKKQIAYAKVNLNVVDIRTSVVVYSSQGAGEYELSDSEFLGFGSNSGYDSTLNGKVLDLAIREAVDGLAAGIDRNLWNPSEGK